MSPRPLRPVLASLLAAAFAAAPAGAAGLQPTGQFSVPAAAYVATPPMGWNPWNAFRTEVTEAKILAVADTLKQSGLADAGYRYVDIDDGWWLRRRADGRIEVRTSMFPSAAMADGQTSLRPLVDRLHALDLKAGLYTDIGRNACSQAWDAHSPNLPVGSVAEREIGSLEFQEQDMRLFFGEWNIDLLKVDACGLADFGPAKAAVKAGQFRALAPLMVRAHPERSDEGKVEGLYASLAKAIATVRPLGDYVLSICTWGEASVADWGRRQGNAWRTSADISATWASMLRNFDSAEQRALYAGPGHWNDPDMLEIGNGEFDAAHLTQARAHLSLWAMLSAPLILGADLTRMPQELIDIARNADVVAVDQDPAGNQAITLMRDGDTQVLAKTLAEPGAVAVALVNRGERPAGVSLPLARLRLGAQAGVTVRDLWTHQSRALAGDAIAMTLAPHETALLLVKGQAAPAQYLDRMPASVNVAEDGRAALGRTLPAGWVPARVDAAPSGAALTVGGKRHQDGIGVLDNSRLEVRLDQPYSRFLATAGVLDESRAAARRHAISYRVYGDGKLLLEKRSAAPVQLNVPVAGVRILELVAADSQKAAGPVALAWADARLEH